MPAAQRREQILEVAMKVFARAGYAQAGTAEIAAEAGISEPTIYRHFDSKKSLYIAVIAHNRDEFLEAWQQIIEGSPDPLAAIDRIGEWYRNQMAEQPDMLRIRFRSLNAADDPEIAAVVRDGYRAVTDKVRRLFQQAVERGQVPAEVNVGQLAMMFMAMGGLFDVLMQLDMKPELESGDLHGVFRRLGLP